MFFGVTMTRSESERRRIYPTPLIFHIVNWLRLLSWICFTLVPVVDFTSLPSTSDSLSGLVSLRPSANPLEPVQKNKFILIDKFGTGNKCMGSPLSKMILNHFFGRVQNDRLGVIRTPLHFYKRSRLRQSMTRSESERRRIYPTTFCNSLRKSYINIIFLNAHHMPVIGLIIEGASIAPPGILTLGL